MSKKEKNKKKNRTKKMKKCFNVLNNPERQEIYEYGEIQH